jgi:predicted ATPase
MKVGLDSIRLQNFKAIRDSKTIPLSPLTAFIGYNGSGKSSVVEGLETLQHIARYGLDAAMQAWRGFEHIWNRHTLHQARKANQDVPWPHYTNPMHFNVRGRTGQGAFVYDMDVNMEPSGVHIFIQDERVMVSNKVILDRNAQGRVKITPVQSDDTKSDKVSDGKAAIDGELESFISAWQFLALVPQGMGQPVPQTRTGGRLQLARNGANVAEYLLDIRNRDLRAFEGIVETLSYVLDYAQDLQPAITSELERNVYLQLVEGQIKLPGWLLSTGTLRLLALLAVLRHPEPPPLIVIEELENGLDPRTIHLIVDEIRDVVESETSQVIITTHSPYLLDLLDLEHVVLVARIDEQPVFTRPADVESLQTWRARFSPGKLYTMGRLGNRK